MSNKSLCHRMITINYAENCNDWNSEMSEHNSTAEGSVISATMNWADLLISAKFEYSFGCCFVLCLDHSQQWTIYFGNALSLNEQKFWLRRSLANLYHKWAAAYHLCRISSAVTVKDSTGNPWTKLSFVGIRRKQNGERQQLLVGRAGDSTAEVCTPNFRWNRFQIAKKPPSNFSPKLEISD